jgi:hypothetical protein
LKKTLILSALLVAGTLFGQVSLGIQIGPPPPPRVMRIQPPRPGPDYIWVDGYWYPVGRHYRWHAGYWSRPVYPGARWIGPRYEGNRYLNGYWEGDRGRREHEHRWDREHDRDYREHDRR